MKFDTEDQVLFCVKTYDSYLAKIYTLFLSNEAVIICKINIPKFPSVLKYNTLHKLLKMVLLQGLLMVCYLTSTKFVHRCVRLNKVKIS